MCLVRNFRAACANLEIRISAPHFMLMFLISLYLTTLYPDRVAGKDYAGAKIERAMLNNNWRLTISKEDTRKIKSKIKVTLEVDAFIQINTHTNSH